MKTQLLLWSCCCFLILCSKFQRTSANTRRHPYALLFKGKLNGGQSNNQPETTTGNITTAVDAQQSSHTISNDDGGTSSNSAVDSSSSSGIEKGTDNTGENTVSENDAMGLPRFMSTIVEPSNRDIAMELQATDSYDEILSV